MEGTITSLVLLWGTPSLATSPAQLFSPLLNGFWKLSACLGERREVGNAEGFAHVVTSAPPRGWAPLLKAWAVLAFHPDGSHQTPEVEAECSAKQNFANCSGMSGTALFNVVGGCVCGKQRLLQILLQGVGSAASSNRDLASLALAPWGPSL